MAEAPKKRLCAVIVNDLGDILPYSCQSTQEQVEEWAQEHLPGWTKMKQLGAKVISAELTVLQGTNP